MADKNNISYDMLYNKITLEVHSSLEAVGLTAAFATALCAENISANVIAGYYHDHIFVSTKLSHKAVQTLEKLSKQWKSPKHLLHTTQVYLVKILGVVYEKNYTHFTF